MFHFPLYFKVFLAATHDLRRGGITMITWKTLQSASGMRPWQARITAKIGFGGSLEDERR
jgi:hypothetical protein